MSPEKSARNNTRIPQRQTLQVTKTCQATVSQFNCTEYICAFILLKVRIKTKQKDTLTGSEASESSRGEQSRALLAVGMANKPFFFWTKNTQFPLPEIIYFKKIQIAPTSTMAYTT